MPLSSRHRRAANSLLDCETLFADYGAFHQTSGNVCCHSIGIPLIVYGVFVFLVHLPMGIAPTSFRITGAELLYVIASIYYLVLDLRLGTLMIPAAGLLLFAAHGFSSWPAGLTAFVVGWTFQGIGHAVFEKKSPAFLRNGIHLLVGPLFLLNEGVRIRPRSSSKS